MLPYLVSLLLLELSPSWVLWDWLVLACLQNKNSTSVFFFFLCNCCLTENSAWLKIWMSCAVLCNKNAGWAKGFTLGLSWVPQQLFTCLVDWDSSPSTPSTNWTFYSALFAQSEVNLNTYHSHHSSSVFTVAFTTLRPLMSDFAKYPRSKEWQGTLIDQGVSGQVGLWRFFTSSHCPMHVWFSSLKVCYSLQ